ncbi:MAG: glycosyltransferase family 2 protein [Candidatus Buchananbacteria bacterium]
MTDQKKYRLLETVPGLAVWLTLGLAIIFSFIYPLATIYFIIAFDTYWLLRIAYLSIYVINSWFNYRKNLKIDWWQKLNTEFGPTRSGPKNLANYYHLVFYPTYKEPYEVVRESFIKLCEVKYPLNKFMVVLAGEERDQENFLVLAKKIEAEFASKFFSFLITVHPKNLPEELPGKGSNMHWADQRAQEMIDRLQLPYDNIICSFFDIETWPDPQYFACLMYKFLTVPNPTRCSYQPLVLYNNNVWQSNPIIRVVASSTTFWLLTDMARSERLFTFSSHSMSWRALVDIGWHTKTIVTEDSRLFLQGLLRYDGDYSVVPIYVPVSMCTVYIGKFWHSALNQYKQMRRWAWGVEHFPFMVVNFWGKYGNKKIPFLKKIYYIWNQTEGVYSWATAPLLIFILGRLPLWVANNSARSTVLLQNAPYTLEKLMQFSMLGLMVITGLYIFLLPRKPNTKWYDYITMMLQWIVVPVTLLIFGAIPATDAQTRLMLGGKYRLGFWVTEKKVN